MLKIFLAILIFFPLATPISAHILKTDATIGAVVHLDPDDDPIAGVPTAIYFEITSTAGAFSLDDCDCFVVISSDEFELSRQVLVSAGNAIFSPASPYTFPALGNYEIKLIGSSRSDSFKDFMIETQTNVRRIVSAPVANVELSSTPINTNFQLVAIALLGFTIVAIAYRFKSRVFSPAKYF